MDITRYLRAKAQHMKHDTLIIARHGKPALSRKVRLTWREYRDWWVRYDAGGLLPEQKIPKRLLTWTQKADVVISSTLRRAVESAELATGRAPDFTYSALIEAALPPPHLGPLKIRPKSWGTWSRICWYCGWSDGMETHTQARIRANAMCAILAEHAKDGKIVYVSAHGWFNRMLKGSLKKRGWKCMSQNGDLHWSHRRF